MIKVLATLTVAENMASSVNAELVNLSDFANFWKDAIDLDEYFKTYTPNEEREQLAELMGVTTSTIEELESVCSPSTLNVPEYDCKDVSKNLTTILTTDLATVRNQAEDLENRKNASYRHDRLNKMKYRLLDSFLTRGVEKDIIPDEFLIKAGEVIMQVAIYRPKKAQSTKKTPYRADHTFRVLGSQRLTDLRDEIRCPSDLVVPGDFSNTPDLTTDICAKDLYRSACFFIEGVFYSDMRSDEAIDYSQPIRDWAKSKQVATFTNQDMASTTFGDLRLRLGIPYLYLHQGDCEHIIVFTELRMVHPSDDLDARNYPQMVMRSARCRTLCHACQNNTARWVTYNDELAPESPCYFCDKCFRSFHYNESKEKVCNFEAYKFFHGHVVS